ncbi:MAG: NAD(P)/FAD-dependent oxidoreductase [Candidatus Hadarchaeota archaeon]
MDKYDVVVVGAGPAGLEAAKAAASEGAKTLLLEMRAQVGGQVNPSAIVPAGELKKAVAASFKEIEFRSDKKRAVIRGRLSLIDRARLDRLLAAEAASSGTEIWINSPVKELLTKDGRVVGVRAESGGWSEDIRSEIVIDATGAVGEWSGLFRKFTGADHPKNQVVFTSEYLMANAKVETPEIIFTSYLAPGGHAWLYPAGGGFAFVGISGVRIHPDVALDEFLGRHNLPSLKGASPVAAFRGQLPLGGPLDNVCGDGVIAVGGSAGHFYQLSGQGLRYAMKGGELAGKAAVDAIMAGDFSMRGLSGFQRAMASEFGYDFEVGRLLHSSLEVSQDRKMGELLGSIKGKPDLARSFLDVFLGHRLKASVGRLLRDRRVTKVFGRETVGKALALK